MAEEQEKTTQQQAQTVEETSLIDDIVQITNLKPSDESYTVTRRGVQAFVDELLKPGREEVKVSQAMVDDMISEIDRKLCSQVGSWRTTGTRSQRCSIAVSQTP